MEHPRLSEIAVMIAFFSQLNSVLSSVTTGMSIKRRQLLPSRTGEATSTLSIKAVLLCLASPMAALAEAGALTDAVAPLAPLETHSRTSLTIVEQLRHNHYLHRVLDDATSSDVFDNYLKALDGSRVYFTAADLAQQSPRVQRLLGHRSYDPRPHLGGGLWLRHVKEIEPLP